MGFVPMKFFVALQLSVLLLGPFTVSGQVDAEGFETLSKIHPPVAAPAPAPMYHLSPPPSHPPSSPPSYPHIPPPSHPHSPPPSSPPSHPHSPPPRPPPSHPPSPPPSHIPTPHRPPRSLVAVQGVVYCKSCKYSGVETLLGASPLSGAVVKLQCNNSKHPITQEAKTDKNGYFFIQAPKKVTSFGVHKCKVFLVSSPLYSCQKPTNLNWGLSGASLRYQKPPKPVPFSLYTVGPFAFGPKCPL